LVEQIDETVGVIAGEPVVSMAACRVAIAAARKRALLPQTCASLIAFRQIEAVVDGP